MTLELDPRGGTLNFSRLNSKSPMCKSEDRDSQEVEWDQLIFSTSQILSCEIKDELTMSLNLSNELSFAHETGQTLDHSVNVTTIIIYLEDSHQAVQLRSVLNTILLNTGRIIIDQDSKESRTLSSHDTQEQNFDGEEGDDDGELSYQDMANVEDTMNLTRQINGLSRTQVQRVEGDISSDEDSVGDSPNIKEIRIVEARANDKSKLVNDKRFAVH